MNVNDGGAAIKRRITMKQKQRGQYDIDADTEAKILGLSMHHDEAVVSKSGTGQNHVSLV